MKAKDFFRCAAKPFKIFITASLLVFIILFFQIIFMQTAKTFIYEKFISAKPEGRQWDIHRSQKCFLPDGTVIVVGQKEDHPYGSKGRKTGKIYDANYMLLWEGPERKRPDTYEYLRWTEHNGNMVSKRYFQDRQKITPPMSGSIEIPLIRNNKIKEVWRYKPAAGVFVGYEFKEDKIGHIGANGFTLSQADLRQFGQLSAFCGIIPLGYETPILIWQTDNRIFTIDFENRRTEMMADSGDKKISYFEFNSRSFSDSNSTLQESGIRYRPLIQYKTADGKYHLILREPEQHITLKLPEEWEKYLRSNVATAATKDGIFLYHSTSGVLKPENYDKSIKVQKAFRKTNPFDKSVNYIVELYKVDDQGDISLINRFDWVKPEFKGYDRSAVEEQLFGYAATVSPIVFSLFQEIIEYIPPNTFREYSNTMIGGYLGLVEIMHPRNLTVNIVLSVLMMGIVLWHGWARRTSRFRFVFWLVFVGLFNLAGLLTYLALNHTAVIKCPVCGRSRGLERPECNRCGGTNPSPPSPVLSD